MPQLLLTAADRPVQETPGRYHRGDPVVVMPDTHIWGLAETGPWFCALVLPQAALDTSTDLLAQDETQAGVDEFGEPLVVSNRRRVWRADFEQLPKDVKLELAELDKCELDGRGDKRWEAVRQAFEQREGSGRPDPDPDEPKGRPPVTGPPTFDELIAPRGAEHAARDRASRVIGEAFGLDSEAEQLRANVSVATRVHSRLRGSKHHVLDNAQFAAAHVTLGELFPGCLTHEYRGDGNGRWAFRYDLDDVFIMREIKRWREQICAMEADTHQRVRELLEEHEAVRQSLTGITSRIAPSLTHGHAYIAAQRSIITDMAIGPRCLLTRRDDGAWIDELMSTTNWMLRAA